MQFTFWIMSNFSYCPLLWLFCSYGANSEINRAHKRVLRALYRDYEYTFGELLDKSKSKMIRKSNLQILMVEIYKTINYLNPKFIREFFLKNYVPLNLRSNELCKIPSVNSQRYGISSLSFKGSLLWNALRDEIKLATSIINCEKEI